MTPRAASRFRCRAAFYRQSSRFFCAFSRDYVALSRRDVESADMLQHADNNTAHAATMRDVESGAHDIDYAIDY